MLANASPMATVGYSAAALGYAALFFAMLTAWRGQGAGGRLVAAVLVASLWAALLALVSIGGSVPIGDTAVVDAARYAALLWLLPVAAGSPLRSPVVVRAGRGVSLAVLVTCLLAYGAGVALNDRTAALAGLLLTLSGIAAFVAARAPAGQESRPGQAPLQLAIAGILACDLLLYATAILPDAATTAIWTVRGLAAALAMPLVAMAIGRGGYRHFNFEASRDVALFLASALAISGCVLLAAIAGYVLRRGLGSWGPAGQWSLYAVAAGLLAAIYASKPLRRRWTVFLAKHFFQHKYNYRREWLRFIATLSDSHAGEDPRVTALRAVAQIIHSPAAILLSRGEERAECRPAAAWPADDLTLAAAQDLRVSPELLDLLERREWVFDVGERAGEHLRTDWLGVPPAPRDGRRWRLAVPVMLRDRLRGVILLAEPREPFVLTFEDRDLLKTVARHVATHLAQVEAEQRLAEARQFEAYNRLAAFTAHDLKNAAAQLQLLVDNAARHRGNPAFIDDAIDTVANASGRISRLIEHLARGTTPGLAGRVPVTQAARVAVERSLHREPRPSLEIEAHDLVVGASLDQLAGIVEHLVRNAQEATPPAGIVSVVVRRSGESAIICVRDSGAGMSQAFIRDRLFRPFDTTKGTQGMGIGAYQARELARGIGGDIEVQSVPGQGTTVCLTLPLVSTVSAA